ncbi:MAG: NADH-quinone oxidoreductase subunit N [Chloroflexaceae bacterium]|nr:NADH-quinone oxidoreductase subunit N [Chloroflexaceae bacterium]NJO05040.1 NADH-quinone oxidoreductase subunit N [Chloroflexaceae bacterium]
MQFALTDVPRILPEILLLVLALLVLGSDVFERWANTDAARTEQHRASASLAALGLGMILIIALIQSGYVYRLPDDAPINFLTNIVRNLQNGGPASELATTPILGAFATDDLTMIGRLVVIAAAFLTVLLTYDARPTANPGEFYTLIIGSTLGMCLMAGSSELIMTFLAIELTSIPLYVLAGYFRNDRQSTEAGMKYFLFGAMSSGILLYGMSLTYGYAATAAVTQGSTGNNLTQFERIRELVAQAGEPTVLLTLGMLFLIAGIGYKVTVVPFHGWSPDVYQGAPTPITAFIATASKVASFILLFRLLTTTFPVLTGAADVIIPVEASTFTGWTSLLALLAFLTLIVGNLAALPQTNAKRLLAYSSIAHAGFLLMGLVAWSASLAMDREAGIASLLYYLVAYTVMNLGVFGVLYVVDQHTRSDEISVLNGLARRNLGLAVLFTIFVFSLAGIPPLSGFFAKFYVFMAAWQAGAEWLVIVGLITTIISLYYYLRLLRAVFIVPPDTDAPIPTPRWMATSLVLSALLVIVLGLFPNIILTIIDNVQAVAGR